MKSLRTKFITSGIAFVLFLIFTVFVKVFDVAVIGPLGSSVGLSLINKKIFELFGENKAWETLTEIIGFAAIAIAFGFCVLGVYQLIKRRSLFKVDHSILLLGAFYVLVAIVYVLFEIVVINYRPILVDGALEGSYPSSHTILVVCITASAMTAIGDIFKDKKTLVLVSNVILSLMLALTVAGRLLSGVHWFTDIIGGVMISTALTTLYGAFVDLVTHKKGLK